MYKFSLSLYKLSLSLYGFSLSLCKLRLSLEFLPWRRLIWWWLQRGLCLQPVYFLLQRVEEMGGVGSVHLCVVELE